MTIAQEQQLTTVRRILTEHFDGWVLVIPHELPDRRETCSVEYYGGFFNAIGLLSKATDVIQAQKPLGLDDQEQPQD